MIYLLDAISFYGHFGSIILLHAFLIPFKDFSMTILKYPFWFESCLRTIAFSSHGFPRHSRVQYLLLIYIYIYILLIFVYLSMSMLNCLLFILIIKWARYLHTITICIRNMCCISYHCSTQCNTFVEIMIHGFTRLRCSIKLHDKWRWYPEAY